MELKRTIITEDGRRYDLTLTSKTIETHVHMTEFKASFEDFMRDGATRLQGVISCDRCAGNGCCHCQGD